MEPSFFLSYWRPWDENSSFVDSWGDYLRDTSLVDYGAAKIGSYIQQASRDQVYAIEEASRREAHATIESAKMHALAMQKIGAAQVEAIQKAATMIGYQLEDTKKELDFLNRRMDIVIEQQRVGLMLQDNIAQLLKIPDSEKERQQAITLGIQFFVNASKDPDLFDDALEEFLKAESMKKQDYFVLHRIGCIYMFTQKHMDIPKALDYFLRAGKYSSVESDPSALRLANILTNSINGEYTKHTSDPKSIKLLAGDSYEKAALASYVLGDDQKAIDYQVKAISYNNVLENRFKLAKYQVRGGKSVDAIEQLDSIIKKKPEIMDAIVSDLDIAGDSTVLSFVEKRVQEINLALDELIQIVLSDKSNYPRDLADKLFMGDQESYANRVHLVEYTQKLCSPARIIIESLDNYRESIHENRNKSRWPFLELKNNGQVLFQIVPLQYLYKQFPENVTDQHPLTDMVIHMPFRIDSPDYGRFTNCKVKDYFVEINDSFEKFTSYACILSNDAASATAVICQLIKEFYGIREDKWRNLKTQICN